LQCVAVCCSVLQCVAVPCVAVCGSVQCVAVCCSVFQCVAASCSALQYVAVCCRVLPCVALCGSVRQCVAMCCSVLQCVAVCRSVSQCVAVYHSVLQPSYHSSLSHSHCLSQNITQSLPKSKHLGEQTQKNGEGTVKIGLEKTAFESIFLGCEQSHGICINTQYPRLRWIGLGVRMIDSCQNMSKCKHPYK